MYACTVWDVCLNYVLYYCMFNVFNVDSNEQKGYQIKSNHQAVQGGEVHMSKLMPRDVQLTQK